MAPAYPAVLTLLVMATWVAWVVEAHRLFYRFRALHPEVARREIPYAFQAAQHPEKFFYFFRKSSQQLLRADPTLSTLLTRVRVLSVLAVTVPVVGATILFAAVVLVNLRTVH